MSLCTGTLVKNYLHLIPHTCSLYRYWYGSGMGICFFYGVLKMLNSLFDSLLWLSMISCKSALLITCHCVTCTCAGVPIWNNVSFVDLSCSLTFGLFFCILLVYEQLNNKYIFFYTCPCVTKYFFTSEKTVAI